MRIISDIIWPITTRCCFSIPPENLKVFWCFQGVSKSNTRLQWVKVFVNFVWYFEVCYMKKNTDKCLTAKLPLTSWLVVFKRFIESCTRAWILQSNPLWEELVAWNVLIIYWFDDTFLEKSLFDDNPSTSRDQNTLYTETVFLWLMYRSHYKKS